MRILLCLLLSFASGVDAGVFRCRVAGGGAITWQNQPCPGGTFQREHRVDLQAPPEFFAIPKNVEIVSRPPVRVVPVMEDSASFEPPKRR